MELTIEQTLQLAVEAHKAGNLSDAELLYRAILKIQPKHPDVNHNLGIMAVSLNKTEDALPLFKIALETSPSQAQYWLSFIDALILVKQFDNAKNLLEQGRKIGLAGDKVDLLESQLNLILLTTNSVLLSKNSPATNSKKPLKDSLRKGKKKNILKNSKKTNQINCPTQNEMSNLLNYYQKGSYDIAQNLAITLTQQYPSHPFGWKVLGAVLKQMGRLQDSVVAYEKVLAISPNDSAAHSNLANTLKDLGKLEAADASYRKAIAIKPDYAEAYSNWGITLHQLGRFDEALTNYRKAITIKPNYAEAYSNLGITLHQLGRFDEALTSYEKAISVKPDFAGAYSNFGNTLKELGRLNEAEKNYKKAIEINSDYAEAHNNLGITLQDLSRLEEAVESYRKAIIIKSDFVEAFYNLGNILQKLGRLEEAEQNYRKVIAINPDFPDVYSNFGLMLQELGRLEEAEECYRQAILLKPNYTEAIYNLGILLFEMGRYEQAIQVLSLIKFKNSQNYLLKCFFLRNEKDLFYKLLDNLIIQDEVNPIIGSLTSRASIKYGVIKPNCFCENPFNYVVRIDLTSKDDFTNYFIEPSKIILDKKSRENKPQKLLINGIQTLGNIFETEYFITNNIEKIIKSEVEKYRNNFIASEEGFLKKWPKEYTLYGWIVKMKSGGGIRPHMHENGWLSGSIYINVPPKSNADSGNLVVCVDDQDYMSDVKSSHEKIIDVDTGSMCLFPASLLHYTIPFESEEERVVLAFDVIPKSD